MTVRCPYCDHEAVQVDGRVIYPHRPDLAHRLFYLCHPCDAYVGCHASGAPFGTLANAALRNARRAAHATFDPLWREGPMSRREAYIWLATRLGISVEDCHIAHFDEDQCDNVVNVVMAAEEA